jgi:hypothetical protein
VVVDEGQGETLAFKKGARPVAHATVH